MKILSHTKTALAVILTVTAVAAFTMSSADAAERTTRGYNGLAIDGKYKTEEDISRTSPRFRRDNGMGETGGFIPPSRLEDTKNANDLRRQRDAEARERRQAETRQRLEATRDQYRATATTRANVQIQPAQIKPMSDRFSFSQDKLNFIKAYDEHIRDEMMDSQRRYNKVRKMSSNLPPVQANPIRIQPIVGGGDNTTVRHQLERK